MAPVGSCKPQENPHPLVPPRNPGCGEGWSWRHFLQPILPIEKGGHGSAQHTTLSCNSSHSKYFSYWVPSCESVPGNKRLICLGPHRHTGLPRKVWLMPCCIPCDRHHLQARNCAAKVLSYMVSFFLPEFSKLVGGKVKQKQNSPTNLQKHSWFNGKIILFKFTTTGSCAI